jgi:site-specific DNA-methyltransferase (adenine-specific)
MSHALQSSPGAPGPPPYFESDDHRFRLYQGDCLELMPRMPEATFDLIFADPPYFLSNGGITCQAGKMVSVHKGKWDKSKGAEADHEFTLRWLAECRRLLKPSGSIWVSGTAHIIHSVGYAMQQLGFKLLNDITWVKTNPPPNLSCRYFTHATETIIWAGRDKKCRHKFNYALMRRLNEGKQMLSVWRMDAPRREEKVFGKHPTQKPLALLERIIAAATDESDLVLDPFSGSATTGIAAARLGRPFFGIEMATSFLDMARLRFVCVPQADSPERLLRVLSTHALPACAPSAMAQSMGVTVRQVQYYRQAAAMLGLLAPMGCEWTLTQEGRRIAALDGPEARRALAIAVLSHPLVRLAARRVCGPAPATEHREAVARLLARISALGEATCRRRAQTLLSWVGWAKDVLASDNGYLFGDISSPSEEPDDAAVA